MQHDRFHTLSRLAAPAILAVALLAPARGDAQAAALLTTTRPLSRSVEAPRPLETPRTERRASSRLVMPVEGVRPEQLRDTYDDSRGGGREHHAIDIHAPRGTRVFAVADGTVLRLHSGSRGGLAVYLLDDDGRTRYYYAHLDAYADGLYAGQRVTAGQVIGYVGDTGNAQPGDYHLHFSVATLSSRSRWWEGENRNPYPLLRDAESY
ncbi:MAG TPA: M23 family metallopeptidase [Longimicrobium sp.]|nr:M23 family metallopeptidase [Longimicrobium sp.]